MCFFSSFANLNGLQIDDYFNDYQAQIQSEGSPEDNADVEEEEVEEETPEEQGKHLKKFFKRVIVINVFFPLASTDPSLFPSEPVSCIFVLMLMSLYGKYLTCEGGELVMAFLNIVLKYLCLKFRFPRQMKTFTSRMKYQDQFYQGIKEYVSCSSCHAIYPMPIKQQERRNRMHCNFVTKVSTTTGRPLELCGNALYDTTKTGKLNPKRTYVYNSMITTLKQFMCREGFMDSLTSWKKRKLQKPGFMFDVTDGDVWNSFRLDPAAEKPFVEESDTNLVFSLNADWYQPFSNSVYSVGAVYLTILNLDRKIRNLRSNMIFVGLMPGPGEAHSQQINNYLQPLVDELKILMGNGIAMMTSAGEVIVRGAVILGTMDLPAAAKAFGFSSHNSFYACRKCDHSFPALDSTGLKRDFSDCWDNTLKKRTKESNLDYANQWKAACNDNQRKISVRKNGTRWSVFHELPYFDVIRFVVFDPMHNVWLGTCKRIVHHIFLKMDLLESAARNEMSAFVKKLIMPFGYDVSSIARKINTGDGFAYFKADEWRIYSLFLSPLLLKGRLSNAQYENWMIFVGAMQVMSMPNVNVADLQKCHEEIVNFCKGFQRLYGKESLYSNAHYHTHLLSQMLDFGPFHSHHAFNYERYNSDLKSIKTNRKNMERTVANKFVESIHQQDYFSSAIPDLGPDVSFEHLKTIYMRKDIHGNKKSYEETYLAEELEGADDDDFDIMEFIEMSGSLVPGDGYLLAYGHEQLPRSTVLSIRLNKKYTTLSSDIYDQLLSYYQEYFDSSDDIPPYIFGMDEEVRCVSYDEIKITMLENRNVKVKAKVVKFKSISILGQRYNSREATSTRGSYIRAFYRDVEELDKTNHVLRPAQIQFFFRHSLPLMGNDNKLYMTTFTFAYVRWYKDMPPGSHVTTFDSINSSCYSNTFMDRSFMDILPVHCIYAPVGVYIEKFDDINIIIDLPRRIVE